MPSCTKLVTNRAPGWYLMSFSCAHEALNTSSSSKHPSPYTYLILSQTEWSDMGTDVAHQDRPKSLIIRKNMSTELLPVVPGTDCSECVGTFFFIFWPISWNTDTCTWLQIAPLLINCTLELCLKEVSIGYIHILLDWIRQLISEYYIISLIFGRVWILSAFIVVKTTHIFLGMTPSKKSWRQSGSNKVDRQISLYPILYSTDLDLTPPLSQPCSVLCLQ